jgi:hypothetical protein
VRGRERQRINAGKCNHKRKKKTNKNKINKHVHEIQIQGGMSERLNCDERRK